MSYAITPATGDPQRHRPAAGFAPDRIWLSALVLAAVALIAVAPASAQVIRGQIVDGTTHEPIPGAFIVLLDSAGAQRGGALSGNDGVFVLRAPQAGPYTLRAERIGYADSRSGTLAVEAGKTLTYRFEIAVKAVDLEGMRVTGKERCRLPKEMGVETNVLWNEVRKALSIAVWGDQERGVAYQTALWSRTRSLSSLEVLADTVRVSSGYGRTPFASESARSLGVKGYVRTDQDGGYTFYGLDARTLLSDDFLETHCFRVEKAGKAEKGLIGLGFEPLHRGGPPDIVGTLWVDRSTSELRYLEFRYDRIPMHNMEHGLPTKSFGGRMYFRHLDNGDWVVQRWWLRMPQPVVVPYGSWRRLEFRIHEAGGKIRFIGAAQTSGAEGHSELSGTVYDSTRSMPLAGANVFLTDINRTTVTDPMGQFRFRDLPVGVHQVAFTHPYLDSLALPVSPRTVVVDANHYTSVSLAVPRNAGCPPSTTTGAVVGFVEDEANGDPLPGTEVRAAWWVRGTQTILPTRDKIEQHADTSDAYGRYLFCDVPLDREVDLGVGAKGSALAKIQLDAPTLVRRELLVRH